MRRRLALAFQQREGGGALTDEAEAFLAEHFLRGHAPNGARPHVLPALAHLSRHYRSEALVALADLALSVLPAGDALRHEVALEKAEALDLMGRRSEQRDAVEMAVREAEAAGDGRAQARALAARGAHAAKVGDDRAARHALESALERAREAGDRNIEASARARLGSLLQSQGDAASALPFFERALLLAVEICPLEEAKARAHLGLFHWSCGRHELAREELERSRELAVAAGDRWLEATLLANLGLTNRALGNVERAREIIEKHVALSREIGYRRGEVNGLVNLANLLVQTGRRERARQSLDRALALSSQLDYPLGERIGLLNLGWIDLLSGDAPSAASRLQRSYRSCRDAGDVAYAALAGAFVARLSLEQGGLDDCESWLCDVEALSSRVDARSTAATARHLRGELARARGDAGAARTALREALTLRRELGDPQGVAESALALGRVFVEDQHDSEAVPLLDEAEALALHHSLAEPGPLASAWLALLGKREPRDVLVSDAAPVLVRAEAHVVLHLAGAPGHLPRAREIVSSWAGHLSGRERDSFWANVPLARACSAASDAG